MSYAMSWDDLEVKPAQADLFETTEESRLLDELDRQASNLYELEYFSKNTIIYIDR